MYSLKGTSLFLILSLFAAACSNDNSTMTIDSKADSLLVMVDSTLAQAEFIGDMVFKDSGFKTIGSIKDTAVVFQIIPAIDILRIKRVHRTLDYTYFVIEGWRMNSQGFLLASNNVESIYGIDKMRYLKTREQDSRRWYYVETRVL